MFGGCYNHRRRKATDIAYTNYLFFVSCRHTNRSDQATSLTTVTVATTLHADELPDGGDHVMLNPPLVVSAVTVGNGTVGGLVVVAPAVKVMLGIVTLAAPVPRTINPLSAYHSSAAPPLSYATMLIWNNDAELSGTLQMLAVPGALPSVVSCTVVVELVRQTAHNAPLAPLPRMAAAHRHE